MKSKIVSSILMLGLVMSITGCGTGNQSTPSQVEDYTSHNVAETTEPEGSESRQESITETEETDIEASECEQPASTDDVPAVYMTTDISSEGLMAAYEALGVTIDAENVAVKLSTGEHGSNYLDPALIQNLVQSLEGTIVECNTAYGGDRANTAMHRQLAEDHGYTAIAEVDIQDSEGSMSFPLKEDGSLQRIW